MNPTIKAQWVAALRSGAYRQGTGRLCRIDTEGGPDQYCCLGVLTDLATKAGIVEWVLHPGASGRAINVGAGSADQMHVLVDEVVAWAGLTGERRSNPDITPRQRRDDRAYQAKSLAEANDGGFTFPEIASIIEAEL